MAAQFKRYTQSIGGVLKTIIVKWVPEEMFGYGKAMRVIESDHERFIKGSRFDFGFFNIATDEDYTIVSLPMDKTYNKSLEPTTTTEPPQKTE